MLFNYINESTYNREYNLLYKLRGLISDPREDSYDGFDFFIDKQNARGEIEDKYAQRDLNDNTRERYEFFLPRQMGTYRNRRDSIVLVKLPKSKTWISIILHMDGGVSFDPKFHKYALREFDKLDRQIILGFCDKYHQALTSACYDPIYGPSHIKDLAKFYKASDYKKRINQGSAGRDLTDSYRRDKEFTPIEESNIFKNVVFI